MKIRPLIVRHKTPIENLLGLSHFFKNELLVVNTGERVKSCQPGIKVINCDNQHREVGGYLVGLGALEMLQGEGALVLNDTIFTNRFLWKVTVLKRDMLNKRFKSPALFGFSDVSFDVHTNRWFGNPGWHVRSDAFGLNYEGVQLLLGGLRTETLKRQFSEDIMFQTVSEDFVSRYHPTKKNQNKEFATYFEVFLSHFFREHGLISLSLNGRRNLPVRYLLSLTSSLRRLINV